MIFEMEFCILFGIDHQILIWLLGIALKTRITGFDYLNRPQFSKAVLGTPSGLILLSLVSMRMGTNNQIVLWLLDFLIIRSC